MVRWRFCQFDDFNDFQQLKVALNGNLELPWAIFTLVVSINLVGLEFSSLEFLHPCFWYEWGRKNELGFSIRITNTTKKRTFSWPLINYRIDVCYKHKIIFVSPPLQIDRPPACCCCRCQKSWYFSHVGLSPCLIWPHQLSVSFRTKFINLFLKMIVNYLHPHQGETLGFKK